MSWMSELVEKKRPPPKKQKHSNQLKTKRIINIKISAKGVPVFTFSLPGGRLAPFPRVSYATASSLR